ncbi:MAG TPA: hypothetical protein DCS82_12320 [Rhodospirillaceae bacterium]|nr:hypothetical protein [Rhodospirillaceae bacterium]HAA93693.1 hypothetical protein [Rhodospirillaceae bacterium]HAT36493.1 hypothetical protein [Rhodospirillaceae bacterium]|tara:strand:+ start:333 stop:569 length:237 start_codon:yes stop_codon:yes gene_type:complete
MSRLVEARERLEAAVDRLDQVLTHRLESAGNDPEKDELAVELEAARAECEHLRSESRQIAARLGTTIKRLEDILATDK